MAPAPDIDLVETILGSTFQATFRNASDDRDFLHLREHHPKR